MKKSQTQKDIEKLYDHARVANEEMSVIKEDISEIKTHVHWIKEVYGDWEKRWDKVENRTWQILISVIIGFLGSILMFGLALYFK